jgi:colicin import membrane protein
MWRRISCSVVLLMLVLMWASSSNAQATEDFAAKRAGIEARMKAAQYTRDMQEIACAKRFVVNHCVREAKSEFFPKQQGLDAELAALNKREREKDAVERAAQRKENQLEQAAKAAAVPTPAQAPAQQRTAQEAADAKAAFEAKQADAKQRQAEQAAKIKRPAPPPKPPAVPRSADAASMAAADAREQARQKDIAARKAAIDQKRTQTQGTPLSPDPKID